MDKIREKLENGETKLMMILLVGKCDPFGISMKKSFDERFGRKTKIMDYYSFDEPEIVKELEVLITPCVLLYFAGKRVMIERSGWDIDDRIVGSITSTKMANIVNHVQEKIEQILNDEDSDPEKRITVFVE